MKLKKYLKYKNSGIDWIGEIPEEWDLKKLNGNIKFDIGFTPSTGNDLFYDGNEIWVTIGDMKDEVITDSKSYLSELGVKGYKKVKKGSLLYSFKLSVGKVAFAGINLYTNEAIASFSPSDKYDLKYLYYHFPDSLVNFGTENIYGAKILNQELIKSSKVLFPPIQTQQKISSFLDSKTAQIEKLIEKDRSLIELLKEKRVSLINQAVTKGIGKNVKMKNIGVEWIREIPESWSVRKLKHLTEFLTCGLASTPEYVDENIGVPFLSAQNVRPNRMDLTKYNYISKELHKQLTRKRKPRKGDVLVTRVGAGIGEACLVDIDFDFSVYVSLTHIRTNKDLLNGFLVYFFGTDYSKFLNSFGTVEGGGQGNLNVQNVENYLIGLPSIQEQQEIVEFLDKETVKIDNHTKKVEKRIELYEEYKKSLIYNVVTGKVEV